MELNSDPDLYESHLARHGEMPTPRTSLGASIEQVRAASNVGRSIDDPLRITKEVR